MSSYIIRNIKSKIRCRNKDKRIKHILYVENTLMLTKVDLHFPVDNPYYKSN